MYSIATKHTLWKKKGIDPVYPSNDINLLGITLTFFTQIKDAIKLMNTDWRSILYGLLYLVI